MDTKKLATNISSLHRFYDKEHLADRIKAKGSYLQSPEKAFEFILGFSFYQGRRDKISMDFEKKAKDIMLPLLKTSSILSTSSERITDKSSLEKSYVSIYQSLENGRINKKGDRLMVISIVNFIQYIEGDNILLHLIDLIKSHRLIDAYHQLDSIWSIGPKIASLILRDVVYIYDLSDYIKNKEDYYYLQPVDTWVHQISKEIGLIEEVKIYKNEARDIVDRCHDFEVNPIHYNQGAWYLGANSHKIVLRSIDSIVS